MTDSQFAGLAVICLAIPLLALAVPDTPNFAPSCAIREVARKELTTESGTKIFVEPATFASDAKGDILLAGPTTLLTIGSQGSTTDTAHNRIFGVVLDSDLNHRPVPNPVVGEIIGVRATARAPSGWNVVLGERNTRRPAGAVGTWENATDALWYGILTANTWTTVERLPMPPGAIVDQQFASRLVANGDSLAWAVPMRTSQGGRQLLLYERREGVWSYEVIPTFNVRAEVGYSARLGVVLAVVQPDTTLREDGSSLIIRTREGNWRPLRRLVHGRLEGDVLNPSLSFVGDTMVVGWYGSPPGPIGSRTLQARTIVGTLRDGETRNIVLDSAALGEQQAFIPAMLNQSVRLWVTRHASRGDSASELRFVEGSAGVARILLSVPDPFYAPYVSAVSTDSSRLVLTGLKYMPGKYITSLLVQFRVGCSSRRK